SGRVALEQASGTIRRFSCSGLETSLVLSFVAHLTASSKKVLPFCTSGRAVLGPASAGWPSAELGSEHVSKEDSSSNIGTHEKASRIGTGSKRQPTAKSPSSQGIIGDAILAVRFRALGNPEDLRSLHLGFTNCHLHPPTKLGGDGATETATGSGGEDAEAGGGGGAEEARGSGEDAEAGGGGGGTEEARGGGWGAEEARGSRGEGA
ncbi:unnamed protein product, partial [Ixodes pacificus]